MTLPALVQRHVERSALDERAVPEQVRLAQEGEMWQKPGGRALRFAATQVSMVDRVAFSWQARFPLLGPLAIKVVDGYADGQGNLEARLLGLPVTRRKGRETAVGEALRYLAELPLVPHAMLHNSELEWRELEGRRVEVATRVGDARVAVMHEFDADGDIVRSFSQMRPRLVGKTVVPTPWGGAFRDYAVVGGIRIPTTAEAYWELESERFVYWRGRVTSAILVPA